MNTTTTIQQVTLHLDAAYPGIVIRTHEEERALRVLESYCVARKGSLSEPALYCYSIVSGLACVFHPQDQKPPTIPCKPSELPQHINAITEDCVVALLDFHSFFRDPVTTRAIKEVIQHFRSQGQDQSLVLISPDLEVPKELEKDLVLLDLPLPTEQETQTIAELIIKRFEELTGNVTHLPREAVLAAKGLTENETQLVFNKTLVEFASINVRAIHSEKKQLIKKSGTLEYLDGVQSFEDIGGLSNLKTWLSKRRKAFTPKAREQNIPLPKGVLTVGLPGCGKSLIAKSIAGSWEFPLIRMDLGSLMQGVIGGSEASMRSAIKTVEAVAPCVLWLDEIEKAFSGTASSGKSDGGTLSRMFGMFLTWMQEKTCEVFVVATANDVTSLPPELLRKGRFDEVFFVDLPNELEREEIFSLHIKKVNRQPGKFDLTALVKLTKHFSGAEIEQVVKDGLLEAFASNTGLSQTILEDAIRATVPLATTAKDKLDSVKQWAERHHIPRATHVADNSNGKTTTQKQSASQPS